jgi:hypothetical protein
MLADKLIKIAADQRFSATELTQVAVPARSIFFTIQDIASSAQHQSDLLTETLFLTGGAVWDVANDSTERANTFVVPK